MAEGRQLAVLAGERVVLRPAREGDVSELAAMLAEPPVSLWWGEFEAERVRDHLRGQPSWAIIADGELVGWLHVHEEDEERYRSVAFDIALNAAGRGRALGREALRLAIRHFIELGHHRFTIDPALENHGAVRAYLAIGFRPVGIMREYERAADGSWRDGLLMDLLAGEFSDS